MSVEKLGGLSMSTKSKVTPEELAEELIDREPEELKEESAVEEPKEDPKEDPTVKGGTVINCGSLNVREKPEADAAVLGVINAGTFVSINKEGSTAEWFKVTTEAGLEGYCVRKFIALRY